MYESTKQVEAGKETNSEDMNDEQRMFLDNELDGFFASESKLQGPSPTGKAAQPSKLAELEGKLH